VPWAIKASRAKEAEEVGFQQKNEKHRLVEAVNRGRCRRVNMVSRCYNTVGKTVIVKLAAAICKVQRHHFCKRKAVRNRP